MKALLTRCQESEKTKLLEEKSEASGDKNKIKQLNAETKKLNVRTRPAPYRRPTGARPASGFARSTKLSYIKKAKISEWFKFFLT